jgi:hypothetical protein
VKHNDGRVSPWFTKKQDGGGKGVENSRSSAKPGFVRAEQQNAQLWKLITKAVTQCSTFPK